MSRECVIISCIQGIVFGVVYKNNNITMMCQYGCSDNEIVVQRIDAS